MYDLLQAFDDIIDDAPLDFLGTGESYKHANKIEKQWYQDVKAFREQLVRLMEQKKDM